MPVNEAAKNEKTETDREQKSESFIVAASENISELESATSDNTFTNDPFVQSKEQRIEKEVKEIPGQSEDKPKQEGEWETEKTAKQILQKTEKESDKTNQSQKIPILKKNNEEIISEKNDTVTKSEANQKEPNKPKINESKPVKTKIIKNTDNKSPQTKRKTERFPNTKRLSSIGYSKYPKKTERRISPVKVISQNRLFRRAVRGFQNLKVFGRLKKRREELIMNRSRRQTNLNESDAFKLESFLESLPDLTEILSSQI